MSIIKVSDKETVNVYKFMEMCGLKCEVKRNILISHKIMLKKLYKRKLAFPENVIVPTKVAFQNIKDEDIKRGEVVIVKDDYQRKIAYFNPTRLNIEWLLNSLKLEEQKEFEEETTPVQYKPGYIKYLQKQTKRQISEEQQDILVGIEETLEEENYQVKEKARVKRYQKKGFGRRY